MAVLYLAICCIYTNGTRSRAGEFYILDDLYYWTMGAPVEETTVLNRAKLSEYQLIDSAWYGMGVQAVMIKGAKKARYRKVTWINHK